MPKRKEAISARHRLRIKQRLTIVVARPRAPRQRPRVGLKPGPGNGDASRPLCRREVERDPIFLQRPRNSAQTRCLEAAQRRPLSWERVARAPEAMVTGETTRQP